MSDTNFSADFDLEFRDAVKDPTNPEMQHIAEQIPEKYKDKSVDDLINMHVNLEKVMRRQGNEVGQLRKLVDSQSQLITTKVGGIVPGQGTPVEAKREPVTAEALLSRPDETLQSAVASNPSVTHNSQKLEQLEREVQQGRFENRFPTYKNDFQDNGFQEWVTASPLRSKLLVSLNNYDFASGAELWELWGEHKEVKTAAARTIEQKVNAATTVRGASSDQPVHSKPVFDRAKLAKLQLDAEAGVPSAVSRWNDPEFQNAYQLAYLEDRVK